MDYYQKEFEELQEELHEVMHEYALFKEDIDEVENKRIKEINELLSKNDEYYFKKAIDKMKDLIYFIKDTSTRISKEYETFNKLASIWENIDIINVSNEKLEELNTRVQKANQLINSHSLSNLEEANRIMENIIKEAK